MNARELERHRHSFEGDSSGMARHLWNDHHVRLAYVRQSMVLAPLDQGGWRELDRLHKGAHAAVGDGEKESVTEHSLRLIREEWEEPLLRKIETLQAKLDRRAEDVAALLGLLIHYQDVVHAAEALRTARVEHETARIVKGPGTPWPEYARLNLAEENYLAEKRKLDNYVEGTQIPVEAARLRRIAIAAEAWARNISSPINNWADTTDRAILDAVFGEGTYDSTIDNPFENVETP